MLTTWDDCHDFSLKLVFLSAGHPELPRDTLSFYECQAISTSEPLVFLGSCIEIVHQCVPNWLVIQNDQHLVMVMVVGDGGAY